MLQLVTTEDILRLIRSDRWMVNALSVVRDASLPDAWIGAGFVRSRVWDVLHGYEVPTALPDVDVIYHDPTDLDEEAEKRIDARLGAMLQDVAWSSKNQARMHELHGRSEPYTSSVEALAEWPETATAVAVRILPDDTIELTAPHGVDDLLAGVVRPTPYGRVRIDLFRDRVTSKGWLRRWPKLTVTEDLHPAPPPPVLYRG